MMRGIMRGIILLPCILLCAISREMVVQPTTSSANLVLASDESGQHPGQCTDTEPSLTDEALMPSFKHQLQNSPLDNNSRMGTNGVSDTEIGSAGTLTMSQHGKTILQALITEIQTVESIISLQNKKLDLLKKARRALLSEYNLDSHGDISQEQSLSVSEIRTILGHAETAPTIMKDRAYPSISTVVKKIRSFQLQNHVTAVATAEFRVRLGEEFRSVPLVVIGDRLGNISFIQEDGALVSSFNINQVTVAAPELSESLKYGGVVSIIFEEIGRSSSIIVATTQGVLLSVEVTAQVGVSFHSQPQTSSATFFGIELKTMKVMSFQNPKHDTAATRNHNADEHPDDDDSLSASQLPELSSLTGRRTPLLVLTNSAKGRVVIVKSASGELVQDYSVKHDLNYSRGSISAITSLSPLMALAVETNIVVRHVFTKKTVGVCEIGKRVSITSLQFHHTFSDILFAGTEAGDILIIRYNSLNAAPSATTLGSRPSGPPLAENTFCVLLRQLPASSSDTGSHVSLQSAGGHLLSLMKNTLTVYNVSTVAHTYSPEKLETLEIDNLYDGIGGNEKSVGDKSKVVEECTSSWEFVPRIPPALSPRSIGVSEGGPYKTLYLLNRGANKIVSVRVALPVHFTGTTDLIPWRLIALFCAGLVVFLWRYRKSAKEKETYDTMLSADYYGKRGLGKSSNKTISDHGSIDALTATLRQMEDKLQRETRKLDHMRKQSRDLMGVHSQFNSELIAEVQNLHTAASRNSDVNLGSDYATLAASTGYHDRGESTMLAESEGEESTD